MKKRFSREFLNAFTNTDDFIQKTIEIVSNYIEGNKDFQEHSESSDFRRLISKLENEHGIYINISNERIAYYFNHFNTEQLFVILYVHWYGLCVRQVKMLAKGPQKG